MNTKFIGMQVEGMRHPLLLQRSLPRLPPIPLTPAQDLDTSFLDLVGPPSSSTPVEAPPETSKPEVLLRLSRSPCHCCQLVHVMAG